MSLGCWEPKGKIEKENESMGHLGRKVVEVYFYGSWVLRKWEAVPAVSRDDWSDEREIVTTKIKQLRN